MRTPQRFFAQLILLFIIATLPGAGQGRKAPSLALKTADGTLIDLAKYKGKVVVVNFWATWCGPCRAEIPDFIEVYKTEKSRGLEIIGVSLDEEGWQVVTPYVQRNKINYPIVLGDRMTARRWGGIEAIPTTFFIDKQGNIAESHVGMMSRSQFTAKIKPLF